MNVLALYNKVEIIIIKLISEYCFYYVEDKKLKMYWGDVKLKDLDLEILEVR